MYKKESCEAEERTDTREDLPEVGRYTGKRC